MSTTTASKSSSVLGMDKKPKKVPRKKVRDAAAASSLESAVAVTPIGVQAKKLPIIGPPVLFNEVQLKVAFSMLDTNSDGKVNSEELRDMLSRLGFKDMISDHLITSLINDATRNGADLITEEQFLEWMPKLGLTGEVVQDQAQEAISVSSVVDKSKEGVQGGEDIEDAEKDLRAAFAVFDQDHNGFITREELKEGMKLMGENLTEADLDDLLNATDTDKDGQINYEEFIRMLL